MPAHHGHLGRFAAAALVAGCCWTAPLQAQGLGAPPSFESPEEESFGSVAGALRDSLRLVTMQHLWRVVFEEKTRRELGGPFFSDYRRSLRMPRQWSDGDSWRLNNLGHPIQGAATGFIWLGNSRQAYEPIGMTRSYWGSRLRATAWTTAYSVQWEVGILSEASIGNVGRDPGTVGWTDHVMTPAGGLAVMAGEDAIDRFVIRTLETRIDSRVATAILRTLLNPSRTFANIAALQMPWHRPERPLRRERE